MIFMLPLVKSSDEDLNRLIFEDYLVFESYLQQTLFDVKYTNYGNFMYEKVEHWISLG